MSFFEWIRGIRVCECCGAKILRGSGWVGLYSWAHLCRDCGPGQGCVEEILPGRTAWAHHEIAHVPGRDCAGDCLGP